MKTFCVLFLGVLSNPARRAAEEIECPARCWEKKYNSATSAYECVPEVTKVSFFTKKITKKFRQNLRNYKVHGKKITKISDPLTIAQFHGLFYLKNNSFSVYFAGSLMITCLAKSRFCYYVTV